jgi:hypothetical protein
VVGLGRPTLYPVEIFEHYYLAAQSPELSVNNFLHTGSPLAGSFEFDEPDAATGEDDQPVRNADEGRGQLDGHTSIVFDSVDERSLYTLL